ncbi:hypothetical protein RMCBS344292_06803 [Rhizopus microsporus]|nr:hypothetical protein RMCBS344292_06803 [Rhizopus microsporus]
MLKQIYSFAVITRVITISLALLTYYFLSSYDSSAEMQTRSSHNLLNAFLRWDALYFLHIAEHGYVYEQETAFFPVMPLISRFLTNTILLPLKYLFGYQHALLFSGVAVANISFILAAGALYKLTLTLLPRNPKLAFASSIAFCLSPPSMFMSSFYTESLFALLGFLGMRFVARKKYMYAASIWAIASGTRSNGILYCGFFFYDLVWIRLLKHKNVYTGLIRSILYSLITCSGFILFQYFGYKQFCALDRPWCNNKLPLLYSFVQKEYWDVGFLSYYQVKQIPNFLLAAPITLISIYGLLSYIRFDWKRFVFLKTQENKDDDSFYSNRLLVYMYLWIFMLFYVLTSMHVQVIIRFFTSLPPFYWFVGHVWINGFEKKVNERTANVILGYFVLYGLTGVILFANFLPPA